MDGGNIGAYAGSGSTVLFLRGREKRGCLMKNVLMEEIRGPSFSCGHIFIFSFSENARMLPFLSAGTLLAKIFIRMDRMAFVEYIVQKNGLCKPFFMYYITADRQVLPAVRKELRQNPEGNRVPNCPLL